MKSISVVIPTIWLCNSYLAESLYFLERNKYVCEILIVNNDPRNTPPWVHQFTKVKLLDQEENLYFNGSANLAFPLCRGGLCCILNDDIIADPQIFRFAINNYTDASGLLSVSRDYVMTTSPNSPMPSTITLSDKRDSNPKLQELSFFNFVGVLMFLDKGKFTKIPSQLVHHLGDLFIFESLYQHGLQNSAIEGFHLATPGSASQTESVTEVIHEDWGSFQEVFKPFRSSNFNSRSVEYFASRGLRNSFFRFE